MEHDGEKTLKAVPIEKAKRSTFQSTQAEKAELEKRAPKTEEIVSAAIGEDDPLPQAEVFEDPMTPTVVNPRQTVLRARIGNTWYSFQQGKKALVPRFVALILEEKGIA